MNKKHYKLVLGSCIFLLFVLNYSFLDDTLEKYFNSYEEGFVERVVDGDTIIVEGKSVRLLGINTPEKGERYYLEAKEFLEKEILNQTIYLKSGTDDTDLYNRKLRYIYHSGENVNRKLVEAGYANYYFPSGKDVFYDSFVESWKNCIGNDVNLCEKSEDICSECIELKEFDYDEEIIILENVCSDSCNLGGWDIKDEGRKHFRFKDFVLDGKVKIIVGEGTDTKTRLYWGKETYVWTKSGDTLFLRDSEGKLVLWEGY